jgi:hypothetical protein
MDESRVTIGGRARDTVNADKSARRKERGQTAESAHRDTRIRRDNVTAIAGCDVRKRGDASSLSRVKFAPEVTRRKRKGKGLINFY